jgi:hypothetical protein
LLGYLQTSSTGRQPIFVNGVKDQEMSTTSSWVAICLKEALNQTPELEAAMTAAGPPARLQEVRPRAVKGTQSTVTKCHRTGPPYGSGFEALYATTGPRRAVIMVTWSTATTISPYGGFQIGVRQLLGRRVPWRQLRA